MMKINRLNENSTIDDMLPLTINDKDWAGSVRMIQNQLNARLEELADELETLAPKYHKDLYLYDKMNNTMYELRKAYHHIRDEVDDLDKLCDRFKD